MAAATDSLEQLHRLLVVYHSIYVSYGLRSFRLQSLSVYDGEMLISIQGGLLWKCMGC